MSPSQEAGLVARVRNVVPRTSGEPHLARYWMDFLATITVAHAGTSGVRILLPVLVRKQRAETGRIDVAGLNAVRTVGSHRWLGTGAPFTCEQQMLDSINVNGTAPWEWIVCPVGLRIHALHHLLPGAPYHALSEIHVRLKRELPAEDRDNELSVPNFFTSQAVVRRGSGPKSAALQEAGTSCSARTAP